MGMDVYGISDTGLVREINEDRFVVTQNQNGDILAAVCDGIGGGKAGEVASAETIQFLERAFLKAKKWISSEELEGWIYTQLRSANDEVFTKACMNEKYNGMGTTLVGGVFTSTASRIMNVGDSRCYGIIKGNFSQLTTDHSYINELLSSGTITKEEAIRHPMRNYLTNAIGIFNRIRIDVIDFHDDFDVLLFCSDGLHKIVASSKIEMVLRQPWNAKMKCDVLLQLAKQYGGDDNITIVILQKEGEVNE